MANYFTEFSTEIEKLTIEEIAWWESYLDNQIDVEVESGEDESRDRCSFTNDRTSIWIHSEEYGNVSDLIDVLQLFLKDTGSDRIVSFSWSERCDMPRLDQFGGGVVVVSAQQWIIMNTTDVETRLRLAFENGVVMKDSPFSHVGHVPSD